MLEIDLKQFLDQFLTYDAHTFLLNNKSFSKNERSLLTEQLIVYRKSMAKLPTFTKNHCWFTVRSFEQSSSEACALYKKNNFSGKVLLDLTGGLGVDDFAFCKSFQKVISVDTDENLNRLVQANFTKLGIQNFERLSDTAENFLMSNTQRFDMIYIDADRRSGKQKSLLLEDASPDVLQILPFCLTFTDTVLLKLSPLVDLTYCKNKLPYLKKITILEYQHEVKEILCLIQTDRSHRSGFVETNIAFVRDTGEADEFAVTDAPVNRVLVEPGKGGYLFEVPPSVRKADACLQYASYFGLNPINKQATLLTSDSPVNGFNGRVLKISDTGFFTDKLFRQYLQANKLYHANVVSKHFVMDAAIIQKRYQLGSHDNRFIYFTQNNNRKIFVVAEKLTDEVYKT